MSIQTPTPETLEQQQLQGEVYRENVSTKMAAIATDVMSHPQPPVVILRDRKRNAAGNRWLPLTALTKRYRQHRKSVVGRPAPAEAANNITAPSNLWQGPQNRRSFVFRRRVLTGIIRRTVAAIVGSNNGGAGRGASRPPNQPVPAGRSSAQDTEITTTTPNARRTARAASNSTASVNASNNQLQATAADTGLASDEVSSSHQVHLENDGLHFNPDRVIPWETFLAPIFLAPTVAENPTPPTANENELPAEVAVSAAAEVALVPVVEPQPRPNDGQILNIDMNLICSNVPLPTFSGIESVPQPTGDSADIVVQQNAVGDVNAEPGMTLRGIPEDIQAAIAELVQPDPLPAMIELPEPWLTILEQPLLLHELLMGLEGGKPLPDIQPDLENYFQELQSLLPREIPLIDLTEEDDEGEETEESEEDNDEESDVEPPEIPFPEYKVWMQDLLKKTDDW